MKFEDYKHDAKIFLERKLSALYLNKKREEKLELLEECLTLAFNNDVLPSRLAYFVIESDDFMEAKTQIELEKYGFGLSGIGA